MNEHSKELSVGSPIVGIGASAGGLEAFESFFKVCPVNTGMTFILVPHLAPDHHSLLAEILQRRTVMPVAEAIDQIQVLPNHVYIIPPNREMVIRNGVLQLTLPDHAHGHRLPIDGFLHSLANDQGKYAIGIILSGTGSDGTQGMRCILEAGGVCMVQEPTSAKYEGMPKSAISAGCATHILSVEKMPATLIELIQQSGYPLKMPPISSPDQLNGINQVLLQIRMSTGHDFSLYKKSTISRRIERRMAQHNIQNIGIYLRFLKQNQTEVHALFRELLINVTCFFRDPEAFVILKQDILPMLLENKQDDYVFRIWVAGCSSGEEAYSIAIVLRELMDERHQYFKVQIYATDLDDEIINIARRGIYSTSIEQNVTPERLRHFFIGIDSGYRIKQDIREMVVFAVQSVIKDPPFTKLDLISCRNLLIYLEAEQQNRLIPIFHYALKSDGVLFLSNSESITNHSHLFKPLNRQWKFYRAIYSKTKPNIALSRSLTTMTVPDVIMPYPLAVRNTIPLNVATLSNRILLQTYAPPSVTTDIQGNILYVHGDTSRFLHQPAGMITTNVMEMARSGLQLELRTALQAATMGKSTLNREVSLKTESGTFTSSFSIRLFPMAHPEDNAESRLLLVSFQEAVVATKPAKHQQRGQKMVATEVAARVEQLECELTYTRENLQATIEEQQATNEELKSTLEEQQATNEELQSANEELETSREELQSMNEEMLTMNSELNNKVEQLSSSQNDFKNLMDNVNAGVVFLDYHLNIRSYTRDAVKAFRLIATDVGRPLGDITSNLQGDDFTVELHAVLETLIPHEREVQARDGAWYLARMQPYRTLDNVIDGVVLSFTDITLSRETAQTKLSAMQLARELAEGIVNTVSEPLIVIGADLQVISASQAFYQQFQIVPLETVGRKIYDLGNGQWNIPKLCQLLEDILPQRQVIEGFVVEYDFPELGIMRMVLNARRIKTTVGDTELILLAIPTIEKKELP